jgi:hypothetical protein
VASARMARSAHVAASARMAARGDGLVLAYAHSVERWLSQ